MKTHRIKKNDQSFGTMLKTSLSNGELVELIRDQRWYREAANARRREELALLRERSETFCSSWDRIAQRTNELETDRKTITEQTKGGDAPARTLAGIADEAESLRDQLALEWNTFRERSYRPLHGHDSESSVYDTNVAEARCELVDGFENVLKPAVQDCLGALGRLIGRCTTNR